MSTFSYFFIRLCCIVGGACKRVAMTASSAAPQKGFKVAYCAGTVQEEEDTGGGTKIIKKERV